MIGELDERRKRGRPPICGVRLTRKIEFWVTEEQFKDLKFISASKNKKQAQVLRDAMSNYMGNSKGGFSHGE